MYLKQSTSQTIRIGPFLDNTDGFTPQTGLSLVNTDIQISKNGGAFGDKNSGGTTLDGNNGWYSLTLDTTDTNTVGELILEVTQTGTSLPVWNRYWVLEESIYDSLFAASAAGFNSSQQVNANLVSFDDGVLPSSPITGQADSGTTATVVDADRTESVNAWKGQLIRFTSGNDIGQCRLITSFSSTTIAFHPGVSTSITNETYEILPFGYSHVNSIEDDAITNTAFEDDAISATKISADSVTSSQMATSAINEIRDAILADSVPITGANINAIVSVYHARIELNLDDANGKDEYSVIWFKDGVCLSSGITSPTVQVIKRTDGTDLVAETGMTEIGSTSTYKYDESSNRISAGEAYLVDTKATIDSTERRWCTWVSRDN